jgi:ADP-heptose:LPS heptosyltransferase
VTATPNEARSILVYSGLELMGDGFMKIPFLRALRGVWPRARITWLAGQGKSVYAGALSPLVEAYLDEVIEDAGIGLHVKELLARPLENRAFDLVVDTQRRVMTSLAVRRIRHRTFVSGSARYWLSDRRPNRPYRKPPSMVAQLLDLVRIAAGRAPDLAPPPTLPQRFEAAAATALPKGPVILGLVPGAGGRTKCWPRARYAKLARNEMARGLRIAFILGPDEREWLEALGAEVPGALFPLQEARLPAELAASPLYTMAVARRLALAVTNDCGTAHILASVECPLVSLFGPSSAAKFAPLTPDLTLLKAQDFGGTEMGDLPLEAVQAAVDAKLRARIPPNASVSAP